jgi:hypothetical protein
MCVPEKNISISKDFFNDHLGGGRKSVPAMHTARRYGAQRAGQRRKHPSETAAKQLRKNCFHFPGKTISPASDF